MYRYSYRSRFHSLFRLSGRRLLQRRVLSSGIPP
ncbi:hypothetical protein E2C01_050903 [Portunus trituberculatus]|uniref:Uncharacterized protein n=1 Tax=Portunus trituberculatus TaxID=210409 RepID=A0A5B7GHK5_PORTR|nr:hypothetical protein [Portunus trituberculatus]